ncbi:MULTISPECIES: ParB/RepB/Spo0J family partition protein [Caproicibacterium]|uniref:ParB/RepB/Spo0J family partition protein n=1 Tax=Caproicibacterium argilliputei TaxID=3030016 RepID=A0AA97H1F4_9FIRM|nr:ParB/RepB/Spo0J family partition protein [Caproicibacterium argilliputei]WOC32383.1 ParB/RepB/Spo0J family partition protein [Caproicibacterium argilliputei]
MKKQSLPTLEEAFTGTLYGVAVNGDQITEIEPAELQEITDQPFRAYSQEQLQQLADSIRENGQQQPCIVREIDNKYIILAGRNRKRACELAGCKVKCIVRECTDAEADLILTETNLCQRHELLPSELARGYAMQKAAYEAKGERKSTAAIAEQTGDTVKTIQRYIKISTLCDDLLALVDEGRVPVTAAVLFADVQFANNQQQLADYLNNYANTKISYKQAEDLMALEKVHNWYSDILNDFFAGKIDLSESDETPDELETPEEAPAAELQQPIGNSEIQPYAGTEQDKRPAAKPQPPVHECKPVEKHIRDSSGNLPLPNQETVFTEEDIADTEPAASVSYQRLTHERVNGIKTGYWSDANKEDLVQRLAEFENAYPDGPKGV